MDIFSFPNINICNDELRRKCFGWACEFLETVYSVFFTHYGDRLCCTTETVLLVSKVLVSDGTRAYGDVVWYITLAISDSIIETTGKMYIFTSIIALFMHLLL